MVFRRGLFLLLTAFILSGCVSQLVETNPPKPRYLVGAVAAPVVPGPDYNWSLVVDDPRAARAYDTTKLAVSPSKGRIEYFKNGEWASRAPRIFQTALIESFENTGRILSVGDRGALPLGDFVLQTDIRRIDLDVSGGDRLARLEIYARLSDGRASIFAARGFTASIAAPSLAGDDVAGAFDQAFQSVITEIVAWTFDQGETAQPE